MYYLCVSGWMCKFTVFFQIHLPSISSNLMQRIFSIILITINLRSFPLGKLRLLHIVVFKKTVWRTEVYEIGHCLNEKLSVNQ